MTQIKQSQLDLIENSLTAARSICPISRFEFPLAFGLPLPPETDAEVGDIGIRFHDFELGGLAGAAVTRGDSNRIVLEWSSLNFVGKCTLSARPCQVINLDTGGSLMDFDDDSIGDAGGPTDQLDPARKEEMLEQARAERGRLMDTRNGRKLMSEYQEHNEIYNSVFVKSAAARNTWTMHGTTREMAEHTHVALADDDESVTTVNPRAKDKKFGKKKMTYNQNAFLQQLQLVVNTINIDPDFDPWEETAKMDPKSKYVKASIAAMNFGKVTETTGNNKSRIKPMDGKQVHKTVESSDDPKPKTTVKELENAFNQGIQDGGRAAVTAKKQGWRVLDEEDRKLIRQHLYLASVERAADAENHPVDLWTSEVEAEIPGVRAIVTVDDGALEISVSTPGFALDIDDSQWSGEIARVARERLAEMGFVRSFLLDRFETALSDSIRSACQRSGM